VSCCFFHRAFFFCPSRQISLGFLCLSKLTCTLDSPFAFHFWRLASLFSLSSFQLTIASSLAVIETQLVWVLHFHWTRPFTVLHRNMYYLVQVLLNLLQLSPHKISLHRICRCFINLSGSLLYLTLSFVLHSASRCSLVAFSAFSGLLLYERDRFFFCSVFIISV